MRSSAAILLAGLPSACATVSGVPSGLAAAAVGAPPDGRCELRIAGGGVLSAAVDVALHDVPEAARRVAEAIHPPAGSRLVSVAREWSPRGEGFRITRAYAGVRGEVRSVLVDQAGEVLERTHRIGLDELPEAVRRLAEEARPGGRPEWAEVVQGEPGEEGFRVLVREGNGARWLLECEAGGEARRLHRLLTARLSALAPQRRP